MTEIVQEISSNWKKNGITFWNPSKSFQGQLLQSFQIYILVHGSVAVHPPPPTYSPHQLFLSSDMSNTWNEMLPVNKYELYILTAFMGVSPNLSEIKG